MMHSQIVQRTPSIYFKFDDENHRNNFSKSSFALDYSVSNQKHLSAHRFNKLRANTNTNKHQLSSKHDMYSPLRGGISPLKAQYTITVEKPTVHTQLIQEEDEFMKLHRCHNNKVGQLMNNFVQKSNNTNKQTSNKQENKLKTEDFFEQFDQKYSFTFEEDIRTHEFIPEADYEGGSKISRGLDFEQFQVEETMKLIQIQSDKDLIQSTTQNLASEIHSTKSKQTDQMSQSNLKHQFTENNSSNTISFIKTDQKISHVTISDNDHEHKHNPEISNERSQNFSNQNQNHIKNSFAEFQEIISFAPHNDSKNPKYIVTDSRHFITKDFNNNSSLFDKSKPIIDTKRRAPFKNIENLIQKNIKDQNRSHTRKKPIINTDLLISTINKTEKHHIKQTHGVWSNPINNKKSSSLECTFTYDNMFKTNAFRETLKSTTLENWRKKYHKKFENLGEKKTVSKKYRDSNIFENLFIRA